MSIIGLYPKQDPIYQKYHFRQLILAKNRLSHFPNLDNYLDNFRGYENLLWKESRNKIFLISTIRPHRPYISEDFLISSNINVEHFQHMPLLDQNIDPNFLETLRMLENAISKFVNLEWNQSQIREFKNRLSNYDYFVSDSAYSEIFIASNLGEKIGFDNVLLNPPLSSGKNGDIQIILNNKKIFLELTSTTNSLAENKIQRIFNDFAEFLGKLDTEKSYNISIWVNTRAFPLDTNGNIDEDASKILLKDWADKLFFKLLIDCSLTIPMEREFFSIDGISILSELVDHYPEIDDFFKEISGNVLNHNWAQNITISDLNNSPFERISCTPSESTGTYIQVDGNISFPSETGVLEEQSFFNKISRSISQKIQNHQFESECPAIILLKTNFWANWFEEDDSDFNKIKEIIELEFSNHSWITGVLIYKDDFRYGRFIKNKNCLSTANLSEEETCLIFS